MDHRDVERSSAHLRLHWPDGDVPPDAAVQFAKTYQRVAAMGVDPQRALTAAHDAVARSHYEGYGARTAKMPVAAVARVLLATLGPKVLAQVEQLVSECDCGAKHAKLLAAIRTGLRFAVVATNMSGPPKKGARTAALRTAPWVAAARRASSVDEDEELPPEGLKGAVGANPGAMWKILGEQIYTQIDDRVLIIVREVLQNSRDAKADNFYLNFEPAGRASVMTSRGDLSNVDIGSLTVTDDGPGMSRRVLRDKFLTLQGSEKGEGAIGGFGMAKAAILTGSVTTGWDWTVYTRNTMVKSLDLSSDEAWGFYANPEGETQGTKIVLRDLDFGYKGGVVGYGSPSARAAALVRLSNLGKMKAYVNNQLIEPYFDRRRGRIEEQWEGADWGGIPVSIKSYSRDEKKGGLFIIRVKGLVQFVRSAPGGVQFDRDWVVDFDIPKDVDPNSPRYPFKMGRDTFRAGHPVQSTFQKLWDLSVVKGTTHERDREYTEVRPDSTDPREKKASDKLASLVESVMETSQMESVFETLSESAREMHDTIQKAISGGGGGGINIKVLGEDDDGGGDEQHPVIGDKAPVNPFSEDASTFHATLYDTGVSNADKIQWLVGYINQSPDPDEQAIQNLGRIGRGVGWAQHVEYLMPVFQRLLTERNPGTSPMFIARVVQSMVNFLTGLLPSWEEEEVKKAKKRGTLNPYGDVASIFISNREFGAERGKEFLKKARHYMRHLVWWDVTVRAILAALKAAKLFTPSQPLGVGFVLDDSALGLTGMSESGKMTVMVNPIALDEIVKKFSDRPFIVASYIHGVACHEIAHAAYGQEVEGPQGASHNEDWSIKREGIASDTLFLLPAIEEAGAKILKMKRRRRRTVVADDVKERIAQLETDLSVERANAQKREQRIKDLTDQIDSQEQAEELYLREKDELGRLRTYGPQLVQRLDKLVDLYIFREWLREQPKAALHLGVPMERIQALLDRPNGYYEMLVYMERQEREALESATRTAGSRYLPFARSGARTAVAACGCRAKAGQTLGIANYGGQPLAEDRVARDYGYDEETW